MNYREMAKAATPLAVGIPLTGVWLITKGQPNNYFSSIGPQLMAAYTGGITATRAAAATEGRPLRWHESVGAYMVGAALGAILYEGVEMLNQTPLARLLPGSMQGSFPSQGRLDDIPVSAALAVPGIMAARIFTSDYAPEGENADSEKHASRARRFGGTRRNHAKIQ